MSDNTQLTTTENYNKSNITFSKPETNTIPNSELPTTLSDSPLQATNSGFHGVFGDQVLPSSYVSKVFGDYKGGELCVEGKDHDIRYKPLIFDGARNKHWVKDFTGDRYSIVLFKIKQETKNYKIAIQAFLITIL